MKKSPKRSPKTVGRSFLNLDMALHVVSTSEVERERQIARLKKFGTDDLGGLVFSYTSLLGRSDALKTELAEAYADYAKLGNLHMATVWEKGEAQRRVGPLDEKIIELSHILSIVEAHRTSLVVSLAKSRAKHKEPTNDPQAVHPSYGQNSGAATQERRQSTDPQPYWDAEAGSSSNREDTNDPSGKGPRDA